MKPRAKTASLLIIDDDADFALVLGRELEERGYSVARAATLDEAREALDERAFDVALIDLWLDDAETGLDALGLLERRASPLTEKIFLSSAPAVPAVVDAVRRGALDFLQKPVPIERLVAVIERAAERVRLRQENELLKGRLERDRSYVHPDQLSARVRALFADAVRASSLGGPVLVEGETGTGKEALARSIHAASPRAAACWMPVNCATLDRALADSELFGHERGAFTGASDRRLGLVEIAHGGTLFLDEIGDLPLEVQAKILRFLDGGEYRRVGGSEVRFADVLVIAATNRDLARAAEHGLFREDLLYRLAATKVILPPLRERPEDVHELVRHMLVEKSIDPKLVGEDVLAALASRSWPGNVRQLRNVLDRLLLRGDPRQLRGRDVDEFAPAPGPAAAPEALGNDLTIRAAERAHIARVLDRHGWNRTRAAAALGISARALYNKIRELGLTEKKA